jgi:hypothetical protein
MVVIRLISSGAAADCDVCQEASRSHQIDLPDREPMTGLLLDDFSAPIARYRCKAMGRYAGCVTQVPTAIYRVCYWRGRAAARQVQ